MLRLVRRFNLTENPRADILSGITVALALVPEAIAFAFVARVDPLVGLYAAFFIGFITSILGGRSGMISGATGAMAVAMVGLVIAYGVEYLFAAVLLTGLIQIGAGIFHLGKFIRLVPYPVMLGFVNGFAIVIFLAQLGQFKKPFEEAMDITHGEGETGGHSAVSDFVQRQLARRVGNDHDVGVNSAYHVYYLGVPKNSKIRNGFTCIIGINFGCIGLGCRIGFGYKNRW